MSTKVTQPQTPDKKDSASALGLVITPLLNTQQEQIINALKVHISENTEKIIEALKKFEDATKTNNIIATNDLAQEVNSLKAQLKIVIDTMSAKKKTVTKKETAENAPEDGAEEKEEKVSMTDLGKYFRDRFKKDIEFQNRIMDEYRDKIETHPTVASKNTDATRLNAKTLLAWSFTNKDEVFLENLKKDYMASKETAETPTSTPKKQPVKTTAKKESADDLEINATESTPKRSNAKK